MTIVHIVHISHRHGSGSEAFSTRERAEAYLAGWAREWWHELGIDDPAPENDCECYEQYFDGNDDEFYDWDTVEVDRCDGRSSQQMAADSIAVRERDA